MALPLNWHSRITPNAALCAKLLPSLPSNTRAVYTAKVGAKDKNLIRCERCDAVGEGPTGRCYALPTKRTPWEKMELREVAHSVEMFLVYARQCFAYNPVEAFLVVEVGCKLAGFTPEQIAPLFRSTPDGVSPNLWLPLSFWDVLAGCK